MNCQLIDIIHKRLEELQYGLTCGKDYSNIPLLEAYNNTLECEKKISICDSEPCDTTISETTVTCNLQIVNATYITVGNQIQVTIDIENGNPPYDIEYAPNDLGCLTFASQTADGLTALFDTPNTECTTLVNIDVQDDCNCSNVLDLEISYKKGCMDEESVNYDPLATIDSGECYTEPLAYVLDYECQPDNSGTITIQNASGGLPPYIYTGNVLGNNIANGLPYSGTVTDALGAEVTISGTIACPFNCEGTAIPITIVVTCNADATGTITTLSASGGNGPYIFTGATLGQIVPTAVELNIGVTDINGCTGILNYTPNCPLDPLDPLDPTDPTDPLDPRYLDCTLFGVNYNAQFYLDSYTGLNIANFSLDYNITGMPAGVSVVNVNHTITKNVIFPYLLTGQTNTNIALASSTINIQGDYTPDPASTNIYSFDIVVDIAFQNALGGGCVKQIVYNVQGATPSIGSTNVLLNNININT